MFQSSQCVCNSVVPRLASKLYIPRLQGECAYEGSCKGFLNITQVSSDIIPGMQYLDSMKLGLCALQIYVRLITVTLPKASRKLEQGLRMQLPQLVKFFWAVPGAQMRSDPAIRIVLGYYCRVKLIGEPEKAWRYDPEDDVHLHAQGEGDS